MIFMVIKLKIVFQKAPEYSGKCSRSRGGDHRGTRCTACNPGKDRGLPGRCRVSGWLC